MTTKTEMIRVLLEKLHYGVNPDTIGIHPREHDLLAFTFGTRRILFDYVSCQFRLAIAGQTRFFANFSELLDYADAIDRLARDPYACPMCRASLIIQNHTPHCDGGKRWPELLQAYEVPA